MTFDEGCTVIVTLVFIYDLNLGLYCDDLGWTVDIYLTLIVQEAPNLICWPGNEIAYRNQTLLCIVNYNSQWSMVVVYVHCSSCTTW